MLLLLGPPSVLRADFRQVRAPVAGEPGREVSLDAGAPGALSASMQAPIHARSLNHLHSTAEAFKAAEPTSLGQHPPGGEAALTETIKTRDLVLVASKITSRLSHPAAGEDEAQAKLYDPMDHLQAKFIPPMQPVPMHAPLPGALAMALVGGVCVARLKRYFA